MSLKILIFVFLATGYVILSAWALDVQNKVDSANDRDNGILDKRDLKSDATLAKFLDPPPEYYRGPPGSVSSSSYGSERDRIRDRDSYVVGLQRPPYGGSSGSGYDSRFSPPRTTPAPYGVGNRYGGFQDRIGYTRPPPYGGSGYGDPLSPTRTPYGHPQSIDFPSSYSGPGSSYYPSGYGGNPGSFWSKKGFPGVENLFPHAGPSDFYFPEKSGFAKSIIVPLIGGAILGITAALVANPSLLHLGTLSGKRRRREASADGSPDGIGKHEGHAQTLAYRAYRQKKLI